jgi:hypothetical protein
MAFKRSKSKKCPICVGCTPIKADEVDAELAPLLECVREDGEVPKAKDSRFQSIANKVGLSPWSLHYHLKHCLIDLEIQDQRIHELRDLTEAVSTAKAEYMANPSMQNATAYSSLSNVMRALASDIEGQQDPEVAVEFVVETILGPMARKSLSALSEELRSLREQVRGVVSKNHATFIEAQVDATLRRVSASLRDSLDDGLKNLCGYYHVELEARSRKRALDTTEAPVESASTALGLMGSKSSEDDV